MAEQVIISNDFLKITISALGAEMQSVIKNGEERLWQGHPSYWLGKAPVMFPICGGLRDDKFRYNGKEYQLPKHGFARLELFEVEKSDGNSAVFLLKNQPKFNYPFDFEFRIYYTLKGEILNVRYETKNLTDGEMYFSVGAHEGYSCPEGIENYTVVFEKYENLDSSVLDGNLIGYKTVNVGKNTKELPLKYVYFEEDALIFQNLSSRRATLRNNTTGDERTVWFDGNDFFLLWTKPGANYICMEPWSGIADFADSDHDITKKKGIIRLDKGEVCNRTHEIRF